MESEMMWETKAGSRSSPGFTEPDGERSQWGLSAGRSSSPRWGTVTSRGHGPVPICWPNSVLRDKNFTSTPSLCPPPGLQAAPHSPLAKM